MNNNLNFNVRKELFTKDEHLLFSKMSVASYEPPSEFLQVSKLFGNEINSSDFNNKRKNITSILRRNKKQYCGYIGNINSNIYGFYVTNSHDLNCYIIEYNHDIYIIFRGTSSFKQMIRDLDAFNGNVENIIKNIKNNVNENSEGIYLLEHLISNKNKNSSIIFPGFAKTLFTSIELINYCLVHLINKNINNKVNIYTTGHSLGGALCSIYGFALGYGFFHRIGIFQNIIINNKINLPINVCSLGSPKIGNNNFINLYTTLIESNLIKFDRIVSQSKYTGAIDSASQYPPSTKFYKHSGFSNKKNINCKNIIEYLVKELHNLGFDNDDIKEEYRKHLIKNCNDTKFENYNLNHLNNHTITIEETKEKNKQCKFPSGTLCHGYYFNISFMHLGTRIITNKPAYKLFNINNFQTGLGLIKNDTIAFIVTNKNIDNAKKSINLDKVLNNKCKNNLSNSSKNNLSNSSKNNLSNSSKNNLSNSSKNNLSNSSKNNLSNSSKNNLSNSSKK